MSSGRTTQEREAAYGKRFDPSDGSWTPFNVESYNGYQADKVSAGINSNGFGHFIWEISHTQSAIVSYYTPTVGISSWVHIQQNTTASKAYVPKVVADSTDGAFVVWRGAATQIAANRNNGVWIGDVAIDNGIVVGDPQIDIDGNDNPLVIYWKQPDAQSTRGVYALRHVGSWDAAPTRIDGLDQDVLGSVRLALAPNGDAVAIWVQFNGTAAGLFSNTFDGNSGLWGTAQEIDDPLAGGVNLGVEIAMDSRGNAYAVWSQNDSQADSVYANRYDASTGTWTIKLLELASGNAQNPHVAVNATGEAIAVWSQQDGGGVFSIYSAVLE